MNRIIKQLQGDSREVKNKEIVERLKTTSLADLAQELGVGRNTLKYRAGKVDSKYERKVKATSITKEAYCRTVLSKYVRPTQLDGILSDNWMTTFRSSWRAHFNESYKVYIKTGEVVVSGTPLKLLGKK